MANLPECEHHLGMATDLVCSTALPGSCQRCGQRVFRTHPRATAVLDGLFALHGIPLLILVYLLLDHLSAFLGGMLVLLAAAYVYDVRTSQLVVLTDVMRQELAQRSKVVIVLVAAVGAAWVLSRVAVL